MNPSYPMNVRLAVLALLPLALSGCHRSSFPQYPANYREYAYVTNGDSNTVSVIDVVNVRLDREIAVGEHPVAVIPSLTRNEIYVVNEGRVGGEGSVSVLNAEDNAVAATIRVHDQPVAIAVDAKGKLAYVANSGSNNISVLNLKTRREIATIGTGEEPVALGISPDGATLVVANRRGASMTVIDLATRTVRAVFDGCPGADDVAILPDSSQAFAACPAGHQIMAIGLARPAAPAEAKTAQPATQAQPDRMEALLDVGAAPDHLALKPDGGEIFATNALADSISEVLTHTDDVIDSYMIGDDPVYGLVSTDNSLLYVANFRSQDLTVYAINDGMRAGSVRVGDGPMALAFSSSGYLLFAVDNHSNDVAVVRTGSLSLFTLIPTGRAPNAIAVKAFTVS